MKLSNEKARHIAIYAAGLASVPTGSCDKAALLELIKHLGYVQLDPLRVVARAHDHILWSRKNQYQPEHLDELLRDDRQLFEHFCHDACVLPMDTLPYWNKQFKRQSEKLTSTDWRASLTKKEQNAIVNRLKNEGALRSNDFKSPKKETPKTVWAKPEHKKILDYLWLKGDLAVSKRENFSKYYDLSERVFPTNPTKAAVSDAKSINWLSSHALNRLGFASPGEIMRFWEAIDLDVVKRWCDSAKANTITISVESANGESNEFYANNSNSTVLAKPPKPSSRIRILNPFDPLIRDRKRLERLFGFEYRIEIYTPAAKRQYGYYVYPLLEFDKFVGRIEVRFDRSANEIVVDNLWPEAGIRFGKTRMKKLHSELEQLRRFCKADTVIWSV